MSGAVPETTHSGLELLLGAHLEDESGLRSLTWRRRAACRTLPVDDFFPVGHVYGDWERPKKVCEGCQARVACLAFAIATNQEYGVWGGTTELERQTVRRRWWRTNGIRPGSISDAFGSQVHLR